MKQPSQPEPVLCNTQQTVRVQLNGSILERIFINGEWLIIKVTAAL
jgi:hypothetical protein